MDRCWWTYLAAWFQVKIVVHGSAADTSDRVRVLAAHAQRTAAAVDTWLDAWPDAWARHLGYRPGGRAN